MWWNERNAELFEFGIRHPLEELFKNGKIELLRRENDTSASLNKSTQTTLDDY